MVTGAVAGALFVALSAAPAAAQRPRAGSVLSFSGTASAVDVGAAGVVLTFDPAVTGTYNTGSFAALDNRAVSVASFRVGEGAQSVARLLSVGGYTFNLTGLPSGRLGQDACTVFQVPAELGQTCSPVQTPGTAISPFELANVPSIFGDPDSPMNAAVGFNFFGTVTGPRGNSTATFTGYLASYVPGISYQELLYGLEQTSGAGGALGPLPYVAVLTVGGNVSGQIADDEEVEADVTVNPEPSTVALAAAGLAGVAGLARRRRRQA